MLREHYREVVTKVEAEAYFAIRRFKWLDFNSGDAVLILSIPANAFLSSGE